VTTRLVPTLVTPLQEVVDVLLLRILATRDGYNNIQGTSFDVQIQGGSKTP
jgi:hypothetical protein